MSVLVYVGSLHVRGPGSGYEVKVFREYLLLVFDAWDKPKRKKIEAQRGG